LLKTFPHHRVHRLNQAVRTGKTKRPASQSAAKAVTTLRCQRIAISGQIALHSRLRKNNSVRTGALIIRHPPRSDRQ